MNEGLDKKTPEQIEFEKYLEDKKGEPITPIAKANAQREMELGAKGGYPVYGDEPSREKRFKNDPEGHLFETKLTKEDLEEEISDLGVAKRTIEFILKELMIEGVKIKRENTLAELEEIRGNSLKDMWGAIITLKSCDFDDEIMLYDLPEMIDERIKKDIRILEHKRNKESEEK
jgi:hypothetical protein